MKTRQSKIFLCHSFTLLCRLFILWLVAWSLICTHLPDDNFVCIVHKSPCCTTAVTAPHFLDLSAFKPSTLYTAALKSRACFGEEKRCAEMRWPMIALSATKNTVRGDGDTFIVNWEGEKSEFSLINLQKLWQSYAVFWRWLLQKSERGGRSSGFVGSAAKL